MFKNLILTFYRDISNIYFFVNYDGEAFFFIALKI